MSFWKWSRTAASDATADSTINWAEGMAPSAVNDSGRAMMAAAAKFRDDISGAIVTGGTSTAYTVASYQSFDTLAHMSGNMIAFTPHATCGATVTLNVDSLGAKPLRPSPGVELLAGTLVLGTPYLALYNNSDAVWYLQGFYALPDASITSAKLASNAVTTAKITDANVTLAKIVNTAASRLLGNPTGSGAAPSEISLDSTLAFSGTSLKVSPSTGLTAALAVDFATKSDQQTGTGGAKTVSSLHQQDHDSAAKAWVNFTGSGSNGAQTINASYNVSSVTRTGTGLYTVTFTTAFSSANYACIGNTMVTGGAVTLIGVVASGMSAGSVNISIVNPGTSSVDPTRVYLACHGQQ